MDKNLLNILACPICKGKLVHRPTENNLTCLADKLVFPIHDDIPVLIAEEAQQISNDQAEEIRKKS